MKTFFWELLISAISIFNDIIIIKSISAKKWNELSHPILLFLVHLFIYETFYTYLPDLFSWFIAFPVSIIIYKHMFNLSYEHTVLSYLLNYSILVIIEVFLLLITSANTDTFAKYTSRISITIMTLALTFLISRLPLNKIYYKIQNTSTIIKLLIYYIILLSIFFTAMVRINISDAIIIIPIIAIFFIVIACVSGYIVKQHSTIQIQNESLKNYHTYAPMTIELINDIKSRQHDFNNQINAIRMLPYTHNNYETLSEAITNYSNQLAMEFKFSELLHINLPVLAGFIFGKVKEAEYLQKNININIKKHMLITTVPEYDLIKALGILLDNALEATCKNGSIELTLDSVNNHIILTVLNCGSFIDSDIRKKIFTEGYSTKNQFSSNTPRGYGLPNLMKLTNYYNGKIFLENIDVAGTNHVEFKLEL